MPTNWSENALTSLSVVGLSVWQPLKPGISSSIFLTVAVDDSSELRKHVVRPLIDFWATRREDHALNLFNIGIIGAHSVCLVFVRYRLESFASGAVRDVIFQLLKCKDVSSH